MLIQEAVDAINLVRTFFSDLFRPYRVGIGENVSWMGSVALNVAPTYRISAYLNFQIRILFERSAG